MRLADSFQDDSDLGLAEESHFPAPIDVRKLMEPRKRRSLESHSGVSKRRHTLGVGVESKRSVQRPDVRHSLPAARPETEAPHRRVQSRQEIQTSDSDSSEEEPALKLPTPRGGSSQELSRSDRRVRHSLQVDPRPSYHPPSSVREAASRVVQSSPSLPLRARHVPRHGSTGPRISDPDRRTGAHESQPRSSVASIRATEGSATHHRSPLRAASSRAGGDAQNVPAGNLDVDLVSHDSMPSASLASLEDSQTQDITKPRTTVVARARRGRGRGALMRGSTRPLHAVAGRLDAVESRTDHAAPGGPEVARGTPRVTEETEEIVNEAQATPRPSQSSRLREIARKVMGV